jgi:DNA-binding transcriptional ArsR family regulator
LRSLAARERTIGELAEPFNNSLAAASKHVKALEHAALVRRTVQERKHFCRLDPRPLVGAHQWLGFYERADGSTRPKPWCFIPTRSELMQTPRTTSKADQAMNDYGVVTEPGTVRLERVLPGPIERVWAYLTESVQRRKWLAVGPMELRVGGR